MKTRDVTIGLAQLPIVKGALAQNLATHLEYIKSASAMDADVVVFPELSLTGYELELLKPLAMPKSADTFSTLSAAATANNIVIIAGCPLISEGNKPHIGAVICFPNGQCDFYAKQYLHAGEDVYCSVGKDSYLLTVNGTRIALAICADFSNPAHAEVAATQQADVYITSALISEAGYGADAELLAGIAKRHQFPVLLSNHISPKGNWQTCGKSSGWNASGELVISAEGNDPIIVLCHVSQGALTQKKEIAYKSNKT